MKLFIKYINFITYINFLFSFYTTFRFMITIPPRVQDGNIDFAVDGGDFTFSSSCLFFVGDIAARSLLLCRSSNRSIVGAG